MTSTPKIIRQLQANIKALPDVKCPGCGSSRNKKEWSHPSVGVYGRKTVPADPIQEAVDKARGGDEVPTEPVLFT